MRTMYLIHYSIFQNKTGSLVDLGSVANAINLAFAQVPNITFRITMLEGRKLINSYLKPMGWSLQIFLFRIAIKGCNTSRKSFYST